MDRRTKRTISAHDTQAFGSDTADQPVIKTDVPSSITSPDRRSLPPAPLRPPRSRWRRGRAAALLAVCVALIGGAWLIGSRTRSPSEAAANASAQKASLVTAPVELRTLSETVIVRGDVHPEVSTSIGVPGSVSTSPVVTGMFVKLGDRLTEGEKVADVSGRPVFVLSGAAPVYRDLKPGMSGADIAQLQAGLGRLGCVADSDGVYGTATKRCIDELYTNAGYVPVPTSVTESAGLAAATKAESSGQPNPHHLNQNTLRRPRTSPDARQPNHQTG